MELVIWSTLTANAKFMTDRLKSTLQSPFISGLIAGTCGTVVAYPFDVVKTFSQLQQTPSMITSFRSIWKASGVTGFYRGMLSPLIFRSSVKGILFASYEFVYKGQFNVMSTWSPYSKMAVCGLFAGITSSLVCSPMELIKISNQQQTPFRNILLAEGPRALLKGLPQTIARESPYYAIYFPLYQICKENQIPFAGGIAGTIPWILTYPLDVIKTHRQDPKQTLSLATFYQKYGVKGFYNGLLPTILRAFPTHFVTWKVYDWLNVNVKK
jgi:solute carrier family 25 carnitine/acylcarnitine transporter 20/29